MGKTTRLKRLRRGPSEQDATKTESHRSGGNIDPHVEGFYQDAVDDFHAQKEKILLERCTEPASSSEEDDDEEEVLGLELSSEEGEGEEFELPDHLRRFYGSDEEDLEEEEEAPGPSAKAWGHSKKTFYQGADVMDDELGPEEEEEMEEEEREARSLQQRMAESMEDIDFLPAEIQAQAAQEDDTVLEGQEQVVRDLSKLSRDERLALLEASSPELLELLSDFEEKLSLCLDVLYPLAQAARVSPHVLTAEGLDYVEVKLQLSLCYCVSVVFYLRLKAGPQAARVKDHPVINRIVQMRQLIGQLEPLDKVMSRQIEEAVGAMKDQGSLTEAALKRSGRKRERRAEREPVSSRHMLPDKRTRAAGSHESSSAPSNLWGERGDPLEFYERTKAEKAAKKRAKETAGQRAEGGRQGEEGEEGEEEDGKRAITYQIARNKGLTPHRKKEQRNPRVKHRNRYRKAMVKRSSQVRPVVPELERYAGERGGIKPNVARSVVIQ